VAQGLHTPVIAARNVAGASGGMGMRWVLRLFRRRRSFKVYRFERAPGLELGQVGLALQVAKTTRTSGRRYTA
jgi:hypothetical protein